jgi:chitin-binding protein
MTVRVPAAAWSGQDARVQVRLAGRKGRYSAFSEPVVVNVGPALATPQITAQPDPAGVRLTWSAVKGEKYRVIRDDTVIGTAESGEYIDKSAQFGKEYHYVVQAFAGRRESDPAASVAITPRDQFPPAPPKGLQAIPGLRSVELAWERSTEPDLGTYRIYRAAGSGEFSVLVDGVEGIAFSDRQIESGTTYRYRLTALDKSGNESAPSAPIEVRAQ